MLQSSSAGWLFCSTWRDCWKVRTVRAFSQCKVVWVWLQSAGGTIWSLVASRYGSLLISFACNREVVCMIYRRTCGINHGSSQGAWISRRAQSDVPQLNAWLPVPRIKGQAHLNSIVKLLPPLHRACKRAASRWYCARSCHLWAAQRVIRFFRGDPPTRASIPGCRRWRIVFENKSVLGFFGRVSRHWRPWTHDCGRFTPRARSCLMWCSWPTTTPTSA